MAALRQDGALFWWGDLGGNASTTPVLLTGLPTLESISAGESFLLALGTDDTVWTFGDNTHGQLGAGDLASHSDPVQVTGLGGTAIEVATGSRHALLLLSDGAVQAWGDNTSSQLGDVSFTDLTSTTPRSVVGLSDVVELSGGIGHTVALDLTGSVYTWGGNANGQLGDGTTTTWAGDRWGQAVLC